MLHKAETSEVFGLRWFSEQCASGREANVLVHDCKPSRQRNRLYAYLAGGSLSSGSAGGDMACSIAVRTKTWKMAAVRIAAVILLTHCLPGSTVVMERGRIGEAEAVAPAQDALADEAAVGEALPEVIGSEALSFKREVLAAVHKVFDTMRLPPADPLEAKDLEVACVRYLSAQKFIEAGGPADDEV